MNWFVSRPKVTDFTVKYELAFSGICHSDCHTGTNDWFSCVYPCVLGHEHAGVVTEVGGKVTKVKVGDRVGVGCFIDACLDCRMCKKGEENYCENGMTGTFNGSKTIVALKEVKSRKREVAGVLCGDPHDARHGLA